MASRKTVFQSGLWLPLRVPTEWSTLEEGRGSHQREVGERIFSGCVFTPWWAWGEKEEEEDLYRKGWQMGLVVVCQGTREDVKAKEKNLEK